MKSSSTRELVIMCDDCESQWKTPEDANFFYKIIEDELTDLVVATAEDVAKAGWLAVKI